MALQTLTDEMTELINNQLAILSTSNEENFPQVGPKGSMRVLDKQHLIYDEKTARQALHNLKENSKATVLVMDLARHRAMRFEGTTHIYTEGEFFEKSKANAEKDGFPAPAAAVVIDIERIFNLGSGRDGDYLLAGEFYNEL